MICSIVIALRSLRNLNAGIVACLPGIVVASTVIQAFADEPVIEPSLDVKVIRAYGETNSSLITFDYELTNRGQRNFPAYNLDLDTTYECAARAELLNANNEVVHQLFFYGNYFKSPRALADPWCFEIIPPGATIKRTRYIEAMTYPQRGRPQEVAPGTYGFRLIPAKWFNSESFYGNASIAHATNRIKPASDWTHIPTAKQREETEQKGNGWRNSLPAGDLVMSNIVTVKIGKQTP